MWINTKDGWRRLWFTAEPEAPEYAGRKDAPGVGEWKRQQRDDLTELWRAARARGETNAR